MSQKLNKCGYRNNGVMVGEGDGRIGRLDVGGVHPLPGQLGYRRSEASFNEVCAEPIHGHQYLKHGY